MNLVFRTLLLPLFLLLAGCVVPPGALPPAPATGYDNGYKPPLARYTDHSRAPTDYHQNPVYSAPPVREEPSHSVHYRCADLTSEQAQKLLRAGHSYLDMDGDGHACEPDARRDYTPATHSSSGNCHWVNGYTRKNGTHVQGYQRCR
jgi:hypothetical protein